MGFSEDKLPDAADVAALSGRWELYKRLVAGVPEDVRVRHLCIGAHWAYVEADSGIGMSMLVRGGRLGCRLLDDVAGMRLRDLAALATSWRFIEATVGVAALNAWYSCEQTAARNGMRYDANGENDGFRSYRDLVAGKKVAVVGHFPMVEKMAGICELTVLERDPHGDDTPDPACEYLMDEQDYLFMTGITLTNKTMPRLLELAREGGTAVILVGPSVVPSPIFFEYGVVSMAGSVCLPADAERAKHAIEQSATSDIFKHGVQKMRVEKPGWRG